MRNRSAAVVAALLAAGLAGCASTPEALQGEFSVLRPGTATETDVGAPVRWGGRLLEVRPERDRTCFELLSLPLASNARPDTDATPGRRFLACREGFADPAAYPQERLVTVIGELAAFARQSIGEYEYRYPLVEARAIHLWPRQQTRDPYPAAGPWWYDPYPWGPYPYRGPRSRYWY